MKSKKFNNAIILQILQKQLLHMLSEMILGL